MGKIFFKKFDLLLQKLTIKQIDRITTKYVDKNTDADVLLSLSSVGVEAGKKMKKNNKIYVCERSSAHIVTQNELIKNEYNEFTKKKITNR